VDAPVVVCVGGGGAGAGALITGGAAVVVPWDREDPAVDPGLVVVRPKPDDEADPDDLRVDGVPPPTVRARVPGGAFSAAA
jgi:hypothetical protein